MEINSQKQNQTEYFGKFDHEGNETLEDSFKNCLLHRPVKLLSRSRRYCNDKKKKGLCRKGVQQNRCVALPLIPEKEPHDFHETSSGNTSYVMLLKQQGFQLPVVRCINKKTGECQIGIPKKLMKTSYKNDNIINEPQHKKTTLLNMADNNRRFYYSPTQREDSIIENLVTRMPQFEPESSMTVFHTGPELSLTLFQDLQNVLKTDEKQEVTANDDSIYEWF